MGDRRLNGSNGLAYLGVNAPMPPNLVIIDRAPTQNDYISFYLGDIWINGSSLKANPPTAPLSHDIWMLTSVSRGIAVWRHFGSGDVNELTGDTGGPVLSDANGNINILGTPGNITTTGTPLNNTITINVGGEVATTYIEDVGTATPNANNLNILGANGITTSGAGNTVTITGPTIPPAGAGTFPTDNGTAVQIAGVLNINGIHGINTSAPGATDIVDIAINNTITLGDLAVVTAGNPALTLTSGDITVSGTGVNAGGNINMPLTNTTGTLGVYNLGGHRFMHNSPGGAQISNTFVGYEAGNFNLGASAYQNVGIGAAALRSLTGNNTPGQEGFNNTAIGSGALAGLTTGVANCCVGTSAAFLMTTGSKNASFGFQCLDNLLTGSGNTAIGFQAGDNLIGAESDNTYLDNPGVMGESNAMRLGATGAGEVLKTYIAATRGITTDIADAIPVMISSGEQLGTISSSIRYKDNVQDMDLESKDILNLRPVTFEYKKHPGVKQYGLIAEEVEQVMPRLVVYDSDGLPETVKYHELPAILLNELQRLSARVDMLEKKLLDAS